MEKANPIAVYVASALGIALAAISLVALNGPKFEPAGVAIGILSALAFLCYLSAIKKGPISIIAPLTELYLLFPIVFGLLIGEKLTFQQVLGVIFLLIGGILVCL